MSGALLRSDPRGARVGIAFVAVLIVALPFASAGTMTWDTLAVDLPRTVRGISVVGSTGFAVGDGGLLLELVGDGWVERASPTTRDLFDVKLDDALHGMAVGDDGAILDYAPRWEQAVGHPDGVESAFGATTLAGTTTRRVEWRMPLSALGVTAADDFGLGLEVRRSGAQQTHPASFEPAAPGTADRVDLLDIPSGTPTVDGEQETVWAAAVHASYTTGPVPFTLYLLRDAAALYALVTTTQPLSGLTFQIHAQYGHVVRPGDLRR